MTNRNDTPIVRQIKKQQRQLKVKQSCYDYQAKQRTPQRKPIGEIHLKGHWLIEAGFELNAKVTVRIMQGCLVLTTDKQPPDSQYIVK